ncbi:M23 family metallopeptidase [Leucobacter tenebrionis]|uniref:M23 family metallopeptidase n=1 Tax=Leucobacter tenebrionis TaxID=2873270 RepID=UPI001CA70B4E|nr:M23 family metallopeptidase [Leucobacter tenebrionis]QZY52377.1 M23 family metallopeptidase [Leucobacter tenebrionis]
MTMAFSRTPAGRDLRYPFTGRWLVQNSPANRTPSHGTALLASSYAIDFVPVDQNGRSAPMTPRTLLTPEPPSRFPGFGRVILAPLDGTVVAVRDADEDHAAYRGLSSIGYALTQRRRLASGWAALAGNHVMIENEEGIVVALCHLQRRSVAVRAGQRVLAGDLLARCGNSGNSTEPHAHIQAMDHRDPERARAVPITFEGALPRNGEIVEAPRHDAGIGSAALFNNSA